jgi:hypothetical protein
MMATPSILSLDELDEVIAPLKDEMRYDPNQPRDEDGKFGSGSGSTDADAQADDEDEAFYGQFDEMDEPSEQESAIKDNQSDYIMGLSEKKFEAFDTYTTGGHENMNKFLRGGPPPPPILDDEEVGRIERTSERIISTLEKAPPIPTDVVVYRGADVRSLGLKGDESLDSLVGSEVFDDGIISTSFDRQQAADFATKNEVLFKITVPKGVKGLAIEEISNFPQEREFLLPPGGFKITGVEGLANGRPTLLLERIPKLSER